MGLRGCRRSVQVGVTWGHPSAPPTACRGPAASQCAPRSGLRPLCVQSTRGRRGPNKATDRIHGLHSQDLITSRGPPIPSLGGAPPIVSSQRSEFFQEMFPLCLLVIVPVLLLLLFLYKKLEADVTKRAALAPPIPRSLCQPGTWSSSRTTRHPLFTSAERRQDRGGEGQPQTLHRRVLLSSGVRRVCGPGDHVSRPPRAEPRPRRVRGDGAASPPASAWTCFPSQPAS